MTHFTAPAQPLTDGVVTLRLPSPGAGEIDVAVNAGFTLAGTVTQFVPRTGETFEDLRYVLGQQEAAPES